MAINDHNGNAMGHVGALEITNTDLNSYIRLEAPMATDDDDPEEEDLYGPSCEITADFLIIGGKSYRKRGHGRYIGNMAWDCVRVDVELAKQIVRDCLAADWHAEEWVMGEGWSPEELAKGEPL